MKNSKRILSFLFFALMGTIAFMSAGIAPALGLLLGFASYLPVNFPIGVLANGLPGGDEDKEKAFIDKVDNRIEKAVKDFNLGNINEEGLKLRLAPIEKALAKLEETGTDKETIEKMTKAFDVLSADVQKLSEQGGQSASVSKAEFFKKLGEAAKALQERGNSPGFIKVDKVVGTMSIGANVTGQMPQAEREMGFNNVPRQAFTIRNGSNQFGISSTLAEWVEQSGIEGSAGMTAEGTVKTQLDWNYTVANAAVKKITSYVKITEEMLNDIEGMFGEINGNLIYQIQLLEETQLITGDGTGLNINGIEKYAGALDLAALNLTVNNANNWDVLGACITQIRVNMKGAANANRIFLNPTDIFLSIHATKSTTDEYVNPVTVVPNVNAGGLPSIFVWGVPVLASDSITAGEYLVADMTKFTIRDKEPIRIEVGLDADDFTKNLVTIRGEERLVSYVKANDVEAFVTGTFVAGKAFLETA